MLIKMMLINLEVDQDDCLLSKQARGLLLAKQAR